MDSKAGVEETIRERDEDEIPDEVHHSVEGGKKDPLVRRQELLVNSGLAEVWFILLQHNILSNLTCGSI